MDTVLVNDRKKSARISLGISSSESGIFENADTINPSLYDRLIKKLTEDNTIVKFWNGHPFEYILDKGTGKLVVRGNQSTATNEQKQELKDTNENFKKALDASATAQGILLALLLTIPFGTLGTMGFDYWDKLEAAASLCDPSLGASYKSVHINMNLTFCFIVYSSVLGVTLCTLYFMLRPENIYDWWWRGKYFFLLISILLFISVFSQLSLTTNLIRYFDMATDDYCESFTPYVTPANTLFAFILFIGFLLLFQILEILSTPLTVLV